jgi:hypothetical protein
MQFRVAVRRQPLEYPRLPMRPNATEHTVIAATPRAESLAAARAPLRRRGDTAATFEAPAIA